MAREAALPCLVCGKVLWNVFEDADNQPDEGTEFRTYGHYGSTFWDNLDGEQLILNVCDSCLTKYKDRLGQQKRFLPVYVDGQGGYGKVFVDRPIVAYSGHTDDTRMNLEPEDIGTPAYFEVVWAGNIDELKKHALERANRPVERGKK